jgi:hypothetical protein
MQRQRLFDAFARAVTQIDSPLLLVIDDLQWCERETLEWLCYLLRQTMRAPLLVLGTVRAEEVTSDHLLVDWMTDLRHTGQLTEIALGPLDVTETTALGAQVVGQALDATQAERLYAETEGSPLFVVESLRAGLLNKPIVPATADRIDRIAENDTRPLPLTLQTVMRRRLRQLSSDARDLAGSLAPARYVDPGPPPPERHQFVGDGKYREALDDWVAAHRTADAARDNRARSEAYLRDATTQQRDARVRAGRATLDEQRAYYQQYGRTADGRVLPDSSEQVARGWRAVMALLDDNDKQ